MKKNSPLEIYFEICQSAADGVWTDIYEENGLRINFSYDAFIHWRTNYEMWYYALIERLKSNGFTTNARLIRRSYPSTEFKKYLKEAMK